mmetsp:Transcript_20417/g.65218  ORF Transcript_20417/g.65218 Transcript_20417/m.65218 type:complete len:80 (+) Transcript_20417:145-384(+)
MLQESSSVGVRWKSTIVRVCLCFFLVVNATGGGGGGEQALHGNAVAVVTSSQPKFKRMIMTTFRDHCVTNVVDLFAPSL